MKMFISSTNTTSHMFMPLTGATFINDCQWQPMLRIDYPLLQFANIMDLFLSTAALYSRFYSVGFRPGH